MLPVEGTVELLLASCWQRGLQISRVILVLQPEVADTLDPSHKMAEKPAKTRILIVSTSHDKLQGGEPTGAWAEEIAVPYFVFKEAGAHVDIASVKGGRIPLDPSSVEEKSAPPQVKKFLGDAAAKSLLDCSSSLTDVKKQEKIYDAIYIPGGHGALFDMAKDKECAALVERYYEQGKIVSAVSHGPAAFVGAKTSSGDSIVKGKKVTAFSNSEEKISGGADKVPYLIEDKLKELGAKYQKGSDFEAHVVSDGRLITGQNGASASKVAEMVLAAVKPPPA